MQRDTQKQMRRSQGCSVGESAKARNPEQGREMKLPGVSCLCSFWWLLEGLCLPPGQEESRAPVEAPRSPGGRFWMWLEGQIYIQEWFSRRGEKVYPKKGS